MILAIFFPEKLQEICSACLICDGEGDLCSSKVTPARSDTVIVLGTVLVVPTAIKMGIAGSIKIRVFQEP